MISEQIKMVEARRDFLIQEISKRSLELHEALAAREEYSGILSSIKEVFKKSDNIITMEEIKEKSIQAAKARDYLKFVNDIIEDRKRIISSGQIELSGVLKTLENFKGDAKIINIAEYWGMDD